MVGDPDVSDDEADTDARIAHANSMAGGNAAALNLEVGRQVSAGSISSAGSKDSKGSQGSQRMHSMLSAVVLDFSRVVNVDLTTCRELKKVIEEFTEAGVELAFAAAPGTTRDKMMRAGL